VTFLLTFVFFPSVVMTGAATARTGRRDDGVKAGARESSDDDPAATG